MKLLLDVAVFICSYVDIVVKTTKGPAKTTVAHMGS